MPIHSGHAVYAAVPIGQKNGLRAAVVAPLAADSRIDAQRGTEIACDGLAASVGWMSNAALPSQAGVQFAYDEALEQLVPQSCPDGVFVAGRVRGVYELDAQREDGRVAGLRGRGTTPVTAPVRCPRLCRLWEKPLATAIQFSPIRAKRTSWTSTRICT